MTLVDMIACEIVSVDILPGPLVGQVINVDILQVSVQVLLCLGESSGEFCPLSKLLRRVVRMSVGVTVRY